MIDLYAEPFEGQAQAFAEAEGVAAAGVCLYRFGRGFNQSSAGIVLELAARCASRRRDSHRRRTIQLRVERVAEVDIHCRVVVGGCLSAHKGLNVPSGLSGLPILGEKDLSDLRFGLKQGVDYVGLSFVRTVEDVHTARAHIEALGGQVPVIAKIERKRHWTTSTRSLTPLAAS